MVRHLVLTALLCAAAPARAENLSLPVFTGGHLGAGLHLGTALPNGTNGFGSRAGRGPSIALRLTRFLNDWVALGAELGAEVFLKHSSPSLPDGTKADASFSAQALHLTLLGRVNLFESRSWSPYALGGAGIGKFSVKASAPGPVCWPLSDACSNALNAAATGLHLTGGGGIEFFIMRGMTLSLEGRFHEYQSDGKKLAASAESMTATLGATFWF
ncbi:MAG: outer membrane beta-barrel protein [Elusimicrobia bacterium]|nr:outer membrane beta-barrel protein [Elusimicrobiota bacterium]